VSTFLTVERARELPALKEADEAYLAHLCSAACEAVERYCKRRFSLTGYTGQAQRGDGGAALFLRDFPVTELQSVRIIRADGTETEIAGTDFIVEAATGRITFKPGVAPGAFPAPPATVTASYTAGFDPVPAEVTEAAAHIAAWLHGTASREAGVASERLGDYARSFAQAEGAPPSVARRLLAAYRNVRV